MAHVSKNKRMKGVLTFMASIGWQCFLGHKIEMTQKNLGNVFLGHKIEMTQENLGNVFWGHKIEMTQKKNFVRFQSCVPFSLPLYSLPLIIV